MTTGECPGVADLLDYTQGPQSPDGSKGALSAGAVGEIANHVASCGACKTAFELSQKPDGTINPNSWVGQIVHDVPGDA